MKLSEFLLRQEMQRWIAHRINERCIDGFKKAGDNSETGANAKSSREIEESSLCWSAS